MRVWRIPFGELDDQRALAQHHEVHMLYNLLQLGRNWNGLSFPDNLAYVIAVHDSAVEEMQLRGFNGHQTPLPEPPGDPGVWPWPTEEDLRTDRWHLVLRWDGAYQGRMLPGPEVQAEYARLIERYEAQGGCLHDGPVEKGEGKRKGLALCLLCKRATRAQVWLPKQQRYETGPWELGGWSRNDAN